MTNPRHLPLRRPERVDSNRLRRVVDSWLLISVILFSSGCVTHFVSQNYVPMIERAPFKATRPIAREIKFVYARGTIIGGVRLGSPENFMVSTNLKDAAEINRRAMMHIEQIYPDIKTEHLNSSVSVREALAHADAGRALEDWIHRLGAISPEAPTDSVLHIDFISVLKGTSFLFSSTTEVIVSAYLKRRGEPPLRSLRGIVVEVAVEAEQPPGLVPLEDAKINLDTTGMRGLYALPLATQLLVVSNDVIADLYKQLD